MKKAATFFILVLLCSSLFSSCNPKKDTTGKITIRNSANELVAGVSVRVYAQSTTGNQSCVIVDETKVTDRDGNATFNYNDLYKRGQAGVTVLDIEATFTNGSSVVQTGSGIIKIEAEKINTETVIIN